MPSWPDDEEKGEEEQQQEEEGGNDAGGAQEPLDGLSGAGAGTLVPLPPLGNKPSGRSRPFVDRRRWKDKFLFHDPTPLYFQSKLASRTAPMQRDAWSSDLDTAGPSLGPPSAADYELDASPSSALLVSSSGYGYGEGPADVAAGGVRSRPQYYPSAPQPQPPQPPLRVRPRPPPSPRVNPYADGSSYSLPTQQKMDYQWKFARMDVERELHARAVAQAHAHAVAVAQARAQAIAEARSASAEAVRRAAAKSVDRRGHGGGGARTHRESAAKPPRPPQQRKAGRVVTPPLHGRRLAASMKCQNPRPGHRAGTSRAQTAERSCSCG